MSMKSVSLIITNDEILRAHKNDSVSKYLLLELNNLGYSVEKVVIVPEKVNVVSNELEFTVKNSDIIIAVGIKCEILYQAISTIIAEELGPNSELADILKCLQEKYSDHEVLIPTQAKVISGNVYPVIQFQRIFILNEDHYKESFNEILRNYLIQYRKEKKYEKVIHVVQNGNANTDLADLIELKDNCVKIEYSKDDKYFIFKISSTEICYIVEFEKKLKTIFGSHYLHFIDNSVVWEQVYKSNENHIRNTIEHIEQCLELCGLKNTFISFNGGKDCTVLLHIILAVIKHKYPNYTQPIFCLYVQSSHPFPEQDEFIALCQEYYNLEIMTIKAGIKDALEETLLKYPHYKSCFMGTRRTDPYSSDLNVFQMTDPDWPKILRVSPLLDWHYSDIWDYLLFYKVPYCKLYDMGYTSLGNTTNTARNPSLIYYNCFTGKEEYLPAYKLLKEAKERHGRDTN